MSQASQKAKWHRPCWVDISTSSSSSQSSEVTVMLTRRCPVTGSVHWSSCRMMRLRKCGTKRLRVIKRLPSDCCLAIVVSPHRGDRGVRSSACQGVLDGLWGLFVVRGDGGPRGLPKTDSNTTKGSVKGRQRRARNSSCNGPPNKRSVSVCV